MPEESGFKFSIYPNKKSYYYDWCYQITYPDGHRTNRRITGIRFYTEKQKDKTRKLAEQFVRDICINLKKSSDSTGKNSATINITLNQWVREEKWWVWGKCNYIQDRNDEAPEDNPKISQDYAAKNLSILRRIILPEYGHMQLDQITVQMCVRFMRKWKSKRSFRTVNNYRTVFADMMEEAYRLQLIPMNPWRRVRSLKPRRNAYGGLSQQEGKILLNPDNVSKFWQGNLIYYLITKIAFLTGMRISEIIGLQVEDIIEIKLEQEKFQYIRVSKQWLPKMRKIGPTKNRETRNIPISNLLYKELLPILDHTGFLFSFGGCNRGWHTYNNGNSYLGSTPVAQNRVRLAFYKALGKMGIDEEQRKERHIAFHSSRRFANTLWRMNGVPEHVVRAWTGHSHETMTDHYTDYIVEDMKYIAKAQEKIL